MSSKKARPKGPGGEWKTGQRVPADGVYVDQDGVTSMHYEHDSFPPTFKTAWRAGGECAYRVLVTVAATTGTGPN